MPDFKIKVRETVLLEYVVNLDNPPMLKGLTEFEEDEWLHCLPIDEGGKILSINEEILSVEKISDPKVNLKGRHLRRKE